MIVWTAFLILGWLVPGSALNALRAVPNLGFRLLTPPWPAAGEALAAALGAAAGAGLVLAAAWGAGRPLVLLTGRKIAGRLLSLAAGVPVLAGAAQAVGLLGLADRASLLAICMLCAVPALARNVPLRRTLSFGACPAPLLGVICAAGVAVILASLAPAVSWDEAVYHMRIPSLYLLHHRVYPVPEVFPSFFPFTGEMLFMLARNAGGDPAARLLHACLWLACGMAAGRLAGARDSDAAPWAAALFLTIPLGQVVAGRAYVEFFLILPFLSSLIVMEEGRSRRVRGAAALAGWLAGAAAGVKYLGGAVALILLFRGLAGPLRPRGRRGILLFVLAAAAAGGVWFTRNFLWTANPVFPLIFGGPHWSRLDMAGWRHDALAFLFEPGRLLTAPWTLLADPSADGGVSPLLPIGLAAALFLRGARASAPVAGGALLPMIAAALVLTWWVTSPLPRYLLPALALICVCISPAMPPFRDTSSKTAWLRRLALAGLVGSLACGIRSIQLSTASFGPAFGKFSVREYRREILRPEGFVETLEALEKAVPASARVYFLGHVSGYDLKRNTWVEFLYTRPALYWWLAGCADERRILIRARQAGLSHLVYHPLGGKAIYGPYPERMNWNDASLTAWRAFWRAHVHEAARIRDWVIYEIGRERGSFPVPRVLPGTEVGTGGDAVAASGAEGLR